MSRTTVSQNISSTASILIRWSSDGEVSIYFLPNSLFSFGSNTLITQPVTLTFLFLDTTGGYTTNTVFSIISSNFTSDSYTWTPEASLTYGGFYQIELSEKGKKTAYSDDLLGVESSPPITVVISGQDRPPPASQSAASHSSASQSSTSQSTNLSNPPARQHTPSQGTIAGTAVGAAVFICSILLSAILFWRRRRRSSQKAAIELPSHQTVAEIKSDPYTTIWVPELSQEGAVHGPHELPGTPPLMNETARAGGPSLTEGRSFEMAGSG